MAVFEMGKMRQEREMLKSESIVTEHWPSLIFPVLHEDTAIPGKGSDLGGCTSNLLCGLRERKKTRALKGQGGLQQPAELWVPERVLNRRGTCCREPYKPK